MLYIYFNYSSLHRFRQVILVSYMVNGGLMQLFTWERWSEIRHALSTRSLLFK